MMKLGNWKLPLIIFLILLLSLIPAADAACTGAITYYGATIVDGDTLEVGVNFKNTGSDFCDFRVFLLKSSGSTVDKEPDVGWSSTPAGTEGSETVSGALSEFSSGTYTIELKDQGVGVVDTESGTISAAAVCAGEIVDVVPQIIEILLMGASSDPLGILEVEVYFKNTGTTGCEFKVFLLNGNGDTVDEEPDTYWGNFDIGEIGSYKTSGPVSQFVDDTYTIQLKDQSAGKVDEMSGYVSSAVNYGFPEELMISSDTCSCYGESITASGSSLSMAEYQCGSVCGGLTYCGKGGEDCNSCCSAYCSGAGLDSTSGVSGCTNQCMNSCGSNRFVHDLTDLFVTVALIVAALILAVCGIKFITSDEPESRTQAKKCIAYVIAALVLIGLSGAIVGVFYAASSTGSSTGPGTGSSTTTTLATTIYIQQLGDAVVACWDSSTGGPDKVCTKIDVSGWVGTVMGIDVKSYLDSIGRGDVKNELDWKIGTSIDKTLGEKVCIKYEDPLLGGDKVLVMKQSQDDVCIDFSDETKQLGDAVVACWDSSTGGPNKFCTRIDVSGWENTVTETGVENYIESIGRGDLTNNLNWKIGTAIDKTLGEEVCLKYDTSGINDVFVMKQSQDALCGDFAAGSIGDESCKEVCKQYSGFTWKESDDTTCFHNSHCYCERTSFGACQSSQNQPCIQQCSTGVFDQCAADGGPGCSMLCLRAVNTTSGGLLGCY